MRCPTQRPCRAQFRRADIGDKHGEQRERQALAPPDHDEVGVKVLGVGLGSRGGDAPRSGGRRAAAS